ncbi:Sterol 3-beta-glucosyltransferase UGT80B1 [Cyphellophora attinorum]|uniref:Sterol 3-beta-glucosyltransferase UGT80B1 n=1 Tax=Cyphellophora attinorum TaxID=1664694 RepID=A0A0N1HFT8_9EURO|nr:Sterol 3-beta-glucosyltransferase UGT80B1 [Phialophora attinorum]KPI44204.1 Sterol 3-beta-glucosyltransferase UGT80B1 [Phialophora attinorum]
MPWSPTRFFSHPLANVQNTTTDPKLANYLSFSLVNALTWQGLGDIINGFRQQTLGLEPVPLTEAPFLLETLKIPYTYCWSPGLVPKPKDWQDHIDVTGFIFRGLPEYAPSDDLASFLSNGPAPFYVGFGSIVVEKPEVLLQTILDAVKIAGVRCIISKGWSSLASDELPDSVFSIGECPHEWLFTQCCGLVHHGGAGTTAAGLLAGKPTVIVPFFGDQPFWGDMVASAGAGPSPIPHSSLNAERLAEAMRFCQSPEATAAAAKVSETMKAENGVQTAVNSFHRHLDPDRLKCDLLPNLPALFKVRKPKQGSIWKGKSASKPAKISGLAAEILLKAEKIQQKDLTTYKAKSITIENRRYDPLSAPTSALLGFGVDFVTNTNELWYAPYKMHQRQKTTSSAASVRSLQTATASTTVEDRDHDTLSTYSDPEEGSSKRSTSKFSRNTRSTAKYAGSSATAMGRLLGVATKGTLVDVPQSLTEGLRATPRLYGEKVKDHQPITDWKSGFKVAGKDFAVGMSTGVVDIFVQPVKGARENGAKGFAAGVAKGSMGMWTKTGYGMLGLWSHSATGVWKSIHAASHSSARNDILSRKRVHDIYFSQEEGERVDEEAVIRAFDAL